MTPETEKMKRDSDAYLDTVKRIEPDIHMIDPGAFYASAAISLKRIADLLEMFAKTDSAAFARFVADVVKRVERDQ